MLYFCQLYNRFRNLSWSVFIFFKKVDQLAKVKRLYIIELIKLISGGRLC